jgi:hypothetical protein
MSLFLARATVDITCSRESLLKVAEVTPGQIRLLPTTYLGFFSSRISRTISHVPREPEEVEQHSQRLAGGDRQCPLVTPDYSDIPESEAAATSSSAKKNPETVRFMAADRCLEQAAKSADPF